MMEGLKMSIPQRMQLLRVALVLSMIISVLLSIHLWAGTREIPYTSVIPLKWLNNSLDTVFIVLAVFCWLASLFLKRHRLFLFFALVLSAVLVIMDVNRLQPWFYIYSAMLFVFIFYNGRVDDSNKFTAYFIILQIILASVYFFSGLSQLNKLFIDSDFTEIISPLRSVLSERQFIFFKKMGFLVPYLLMFTGLGLIISPIRYLAITVALLIHFLLLIFLFPSERHQNYALWFANIAFMMMLLLMFSGKTKQRYFSPTFLFQMPLFYVIISLFVIMPFFNSGKGWPDFLSGNFKSGNTNSAVISLSETAVAQLPSRLKRYCSVNYSFMVFNYKQWYLEELHADCFPSQTVFNSIYNCLKTSGSGDVKEIELQLIPKQKLLLKP